MLVTPEDEAPPREFSESRAIAIVVIHCLSYLALLSVWIIPNSGHPVIESVGKFAGLFVVSLLTVLHIASAAGQYRACFWLITLLHAIAWAGVLIAWIDYPMNGYMVAWFFIGVWFCEFIIGIPGL